tara:strand:+ start:90 stop:557 length:468 start_codon:yes stop_codon:yes gene_type:complete
MLADLPPPIPLVCTIQSVESEWLHQPIKGIRELNHQQFVLHQGSVPAIAPRTVVDSRITTLVDQFSSSGVIQTGPAQITYQWSFEASLGMLGLVEDAKNTSYASSNSMVVVSGKLTIRDRLTFDLKQQSRLTEADSNKPLNTLQETATGQCREQR